MNNITYSKVRDLVARPEGETSNHDFEGSDGGPLP